MGAEEAAAEAAAALPNFPQWTEGLAVLVIALISALVSEGK